MGYRAGPLSFTFLTATIISGADAHAAEGQITPGYQPLSESDEAGIWMTVDKMEEFFRHSPLTVKDEALNAYVRNIVCNLATDHCDSIRLYIIEDPNFNASCYPNGMVHVNAGLLLRAQNEAQLASVLGHKITHYVERHTLDQYQSARTTSNFLAFLSLGVAGASVSAGVN